MNLRDTAQRITAERMQWDADANGLQAHAARMIAEGTHGARDVAHVLAELEVARINADNLAEAEHHAWEAVTDAELREHREFLNWNDSHLDDLGD